MLKLCFSSCIFASILGFACDYVAVVLVEVATERVLVKLEDDYLSCFTKEQ